MEKCKFCQADLAENGTFCPNCGKNNAEEEVIAPAAEEMTVSEAVETQEETAAAPEETVENVITAEPEKKKPTPGKIALAVVAVVVLAAVLIAMIVTGVNSQKAEGGSVASEPAVTEESVAATVPADGNPDDATCKGTYTVSDEEARENLDTVVAAIGEHQLTNGQLQVYYWNMVNNYLSSDYGYYMMMYGALDYTQPLDTQICAEDESMTWQQFFLKEALDYWQMSLSLSQEAKKAGMEISAEDQEYLDNLLTSLEETAASYEMTVEELMMHNVGPGAGVEEFSYFQNLYCQGKDYYQAELAKFTPTDAQLEAFFAEHEEDYAAGGITKDGKYVDVRHILIQVEGGTTDENGATTYSDEEWETCRSEAQAILDSYLAGEKTEESFAALANEKSEDPGSNTNGGLYENVYQGQMVEPFENWCFDESRQYGDTGLVQTTYGYHVMYYVGSEPMWISYAESDWIGEQTNLFLENLTENYPIDVEYDKISLGYIALG